MRPLFVRLKGFRGILSGLGVEEIALDLSGLPEGLVAVTGPNGAGKTTLLDSLHPYRIMPYKLRRAKEWSPGAFSYYDQCYGRDAAKELRWAHNGQTYRSLVLIDAEKRKQEAYLYVSQGPEWEPLNDGKTKTYDEAVEGLLGSPSLFFTAVYRAQGARGLSEYTRGDIMEIISELLSIDAIKEQGEKAREVCRQLEARASPERVRLETLRNGMRQLPAFRKRRLEEEAELRRLEDQHRNIATSLQDAQAALSGAEQRLASREADQSRLSTLEAAWRSHDRTLDALDAEKHRADNALETVRRAIAGRLAAALSAINEDRGAVEAQDNTARAQHAERIRSVKERLERARKIVANAAEIRARVQDESTAKEQLQQLDFREAGLAEEIKSLRAKTDQLAEVRRSMQETEGLLERARTAREHQQDRVRVALRRAQQAATQLDGLDCAGRGDGWVNEACALLQDAVAAKQAIPGLQADLESLAQKSPAEHEHEHRLQLLSMDRDALAAFAAQLAQREKEHDEVRRERDAARDKLKALAKWTSALPELERADQTIAECEAELAAASKVLEEALQRLAKQRTELDAREQSARDASAEEETTANTDHELKCQKLATERTRVHEERTHIHKEWSELRDLLCGDAEDVEGIRARAQDLRERMEQANKALRDQHAALGAVQTLERNLEEKETETAQTEALLRRYEEEIAIYRLVERACSNSGIIALEIDDAGPGISALANDLLASCYGSRFSLRIETQSEKRDGTAREDFDIRIYDADTGSTASIREMSGGQATWIEDALTRAICLYRIGCSGHTYLTLFSDEKDGSLDAERKHEFIAVKRRALEVGTHEREFFITQTPELVDLADARIVVRDGRAVIA